MLNDAGLQGLLDGSSKDVFVQEAEAWTCSEEWQNSFVMFDVANVLRLTYDVCKEKTQSDVWKSFKWNVRGSLNRSLIHEVSV